MKKIIFSLMVIFQLGVFLIMVYQKSMIASKGREYRFAVGAYDPYDFMRGNYLRISLEQVEVDVHEGEASQGENKKGYFLIEERNGMGIIKSFVRRKPREGDYIRGEVSYTYEGKHILKNPFERFYIEQSRAREMEKELRESRDAFIRVRIYKGSYVIEGIEI